MAPTGRLLAVAALSFLCLQELSGDLGSAFAQSQPSLHRIVHAAENDGGLMPELPPSGLMPMPELSPSGSPKPFVPFLAPAPLAPFFNNSTPKLSGKCTLNFTAVDKLMTTTAVDCFTSFAPFLANVICCPQLQATLAILIGQSSKQTGSLALDPTVANYCLSDVQALLLSQGASDNLHSLCSVHLSNVTEGSCPVSTVDAFESVIDSSKLLEACRKVDPVNECCSQTCQKAINEAAQKISMKDGGLTSYAGSPKVDSCRNIVLRWLSSRLDPPSAKQMLRQISNCNVNGGTSK
uniref:SPARK domain-containing protein n=1 Tax=Arundo donax TaxID=35708 RepID=A0A0A9G2W1_ARUDO